MMMMMMLMPVLEVVVVVIFISTRPYVASLELFVEIVRELTDYLCRMLLLLLGTSLFQSMMKSVHAVWLGEIGMLLLMMIVVMMMTMLLL
jgi:hypothetical protein